MSPCLAVFPNDPLQRYLDKGEVKPRYYNPEDLFDEVHFFTFANADASPQAVQPLVGEACPFVHPLGPLSLLNFPSAFGRARRAVHAVQPDIVRAYNPRQVGAPAIYAARGLGIPSVTSTHNDYVRERLRQPSLRRWLCVLLERYCYRNASVSLCVSEHLTQHARHCGAERTPVIYNRVYAQALEPKPPIETAPTTVISVGRLDPQKRQDILIRALAELPSLSLTLIGQGSERQRLQSLARDLNLVERVHFIPRIPHAEIFATYREADVFAMATDYEGFCIPVLEAMAVGLPCVVCDTPPLPEVLGGCGLVVQNDPTAFAAALRELLDQPDRRQALAMAARERALALDGTIMEKQEADLYRELLADRNGTPPAT